MEELVLSHAKELESGVVPQIEVPTSYEVYIQNLPVGDGMYTVIICPREQSSSQLNPKYIILDGREQGLTSWDEEQIFDYFG